MRNNITALKIAIRLQTANPLYVFKKINIFKVIIVFIMSIISLNTLYAQPAEKNQPDAPKPKPRITWESVQGAGGYLVELRKDNVVILSEITKKTFYEIDVNVVSLEPGDYKLRISSLDKNNEIASDSPWLNVEVKRAREVAPPVIPKQYFVGLGLPVNFVFGSWDSILSASLFQGINLYGSYYTPIQFLGAACQIDVLYFGSKSTANKVNSRLLLSSLDVGAFYHNNFNLPVEFIAGLNLGLVLSSITIDDNGKTTNLKTIDPAIMPEISVRYTYEYFFIEPVISMKNIFYYEKTFTSFRAVIRAGAAF